MKQKKSPPVFIRPLFRANTEMTERFSPKISRSLRITGASGTVNIVVGLGKLSMGIASMSFFTCVNAFYTLGMVVAKYYALSGILKAKNKQEQYNYYFLSGIILIAASLLYIAYSVRLFFHPATSVYHEYVAMGIAAFAFTELTLNLRGVIIERHNHTPLIHAIKMINLASSLICLVLTQTAILSFADTQAHTHPAANGLMGILTGSCAAALGVFMMVRIQKIKNGTNYRTAYRRVKNLMKKEALPYKIKPVRYQEEEEQTPLLQIRIADDMPNETFVLLKEKANRQLQINLVHFNRD